MIRGMKKSLFGATAVLAGLMSSTSIANAADNLVDAMTTAYLNNPTLEAARANQRATDESVNQALSGWRPRIEATGSWARTDSQRTGVGFLPSQQVTKPKSVGVSITQPVFRSFQTMNGSREARSNAEAGRAQLTNIEQQIFISVVQAYSNVIRDETVLESTTNNVMSLQRQLQASEDRFSVGEITRTDVAQSRARLSRAESEKINAEAILTASRAAYHRVVGNEPGTLEREIQLPALPASEEAAYDLVSRMHPVILAAKATEKAADYAVKKQYGTLGPEVTVGASYTKSWDGFVAGDTNTAKTIQANIRVPIYQAGVQASVVRQAKHRRSQSRMDLIAAEREVQELVRNAWESFREATARITSTESQLEANEIALEGVRQEAEVGARTILDVLDAEQELLDARVNNATAVRDRTVAAYNLLATIGQLNASDLGLNVEVYDAEGHSEDTEWRIYGFGTEE